LFYFASSISVLAHIGTGSLIRSCLSSLAWQYLAGHGDCYFSVLNELTALFLADKKKSSSVKLFL
jgi:hypothetical protein